MAHVNDGSMAITLGDAGVLSEIDRSGMLASISALPSQLSASIRSRIKVGDGADRLCFCGIGGSAMGADVLTDYVNKNTDVMSSVIRGTELPRWVDDDTLIVVISYSGNTRETLRMFELARSTGGEIVAISSGGQLLNLCRDSGISFIKVPPDVQPRAALGHLLGAASSIIEAADIYPVATELGVIAPKLETLVKDLQPNFKGRE